MPVKAGLQISVGLAGTTVDKQGGCGNSRHAERKSATGAVRSSGKSLECASLRTDTWAQIDKTAPE